LTVVAAGPRVSVERIKPILRALGEHVFVVGEAPEKANLVKVAGNLMVATVIESFGEALALVRKGGIDANVFYDVVTSAVFSAPVYKLYGRLIIDENYVPPGFTMKLGLKDIELALAAGDELIVPLPLASLIRDHFLEAIVAGSAEKDWVSMASLLATKAGL
jgi:3-hydroxyisobutyrate dehydrogenase-like beta-hydroxyacid dehydrogenase